MKFIHERLPMIYLLGATLAAIVMVGVSTAP